MPTTIRDIVFSDVRNIDILNGAKISLLAIGDIDGDEIDELIIAHTENTISVIKVIKYYEINNNTMNLTFIWNI